MLDLGGKPFDPKILSEAMTGAVTNTFVEMCSVKVTQPPSLKKAPIRVTKEGKIQADGYEKLDATSFISIIAFALSPKHYEENKISGFLTVYLKEGCALKLFQSMGFPVVDDGSGSPTVEVDGDFYDSADVENSDRIVKDMCGEFCNLIAGSLKNQVTNSGFVDLSMSAPETSINHLLSEIILPPGITECQEMSFYLFDTKAVVVDAAMASLPRRMD